MCYFVHLRSRYFLKYFSRILNLIFFLRSKKPFFTPVAKIGKIDLLIPFFHFWDVENIIRRGTKLATRVSEIHFSPDFILSQEPGRSGYNSVM
jgi:hypothetical protein